MALATAANPIIEHDSSKPTSKSTIPEGQIREFNDFLTRARSMELLKIRSKPKSTWKMTYGRDWDSAADSAILTARQIADGIKVKDTWKKSIPKREVAGGAFIQSSAMNAALWAGWNATIEAAKLAGREKEVKAAQDSLFVTGEQFEYDVGLMAGLILVKDLEFEGKDKYLKHAMERMEVWERGYGLKCDVNGELYVYAPAPYQPEKVENHLRGKVK